MKRDISKIVNEAEEAFWQKVAEMCPDIKTGDFPPDAAFALTSSMNDAVERWIKLNFEKSVCDGNLMVSLTDDAYEFDDFYTLEVTEMDGEEGIENDSATTSLPISADTETIHLYLSNALSVARGLCLNGDVNVRKP